jgi:hypothetical protein
MYFNTREKFKKDEIFVLEIPEGSSLFCKNAKAFTRIAKR